MRPGEPRRPGEVPDDARDVRLDAAAADVHEGHDTDGDGLPDTLLTDDGVDLLVLTDLDGDGLADRVLRIGPDGSVQAHPGGGDPGDDAGTGSAPAHSVWAGLLGRLLGPEP